MTVCGARGLAGIAEVVYIDEYLPDDTAHATYCCSRGDGGLLTERCRLRICRHQSAKGISLWDEMVVEFFHQKMHSGAGVILRRVMGVVRSQQSLSVGNSYSLMGKQLIV